MVVYMCSSLLHLPPGSGHFSQAEKKTTVFKYEQTQNGYNCHFVNLLTLATVISSQLEVNNLSHEPTGTANRDVLFDKCTTYCAQVP